ncbi:hypothetical protein [Chlamydia abortus]|nr:hypothetical protein [Chlamydia abortus]SFV97008.1 Uncharacterised protein [Chlamydia abortus]SFV97168.1 Uncharacterised protein [Chlamydia abortus]SFV99975.1 Uncharacterised protein [Chlamydia abortus]SFW00033.1 Uncharacterised protein [Chlamydia abortus]SFW01645.1 Uncharacterised protein [Chlamydia abortus]
MSFVTSLNVVANGLGRIDLSREAVLAFNKQEHLCPSITELLLQH